MDWMQLLRGLRRVRTQTSVFAAEFFVSYFSVGSGTRIANGRIDCARFRAR
jgi:hypothetical protein